MKLYEIAAKYKEITDIITDAGGEFTPDIEKALIEISDSMDVKAQNIAYIIADAVDDIETIQKHIDRLTALKSAREKSVDGIKNYLKNAMVYSGIKEIKCDLFKLSIKESKAIEITDEELLPDAAFVVVPQSRKVSKTAIKELLKEGEVNGARQITNYNLNIK